MTKVRVEPKSCDQGCRQYDACTLSVTLCRRFMITVTCKKKIWTRTTRNGSLQKRIFCLNYVVAQQSTLIFFFFVEI